MNRITHYMLHDPIGNVEGQIVDFDKEKLEAAAAAGMVFIAVHEDNTREIVNVADVHEITEPIGEAFHVATPDYVDQRVGAILTAIEKIAEAIKPKLGAAASLAVTKAIADCKEVAKPTVAVVVAEKTVEPDNMTVVTTETTERG